MTLKLTLCVLVHLVLPACTQEPNNLMHEWETVAVGHRQTVVLPDKRSVEVQTLSTNPPVFLVPSFLPDRSCDEVVGLASSQELKPSTIGGNAKEVAEVRSSSKGARRVLSTFTSDPEQALLTEFELETLSGEVFGIPNYNHSELLASLDLHVPLGEPVKVRTLAKLHKKLAAYFQEVKLEQPHRQLRYSDQYWLTPDDRSTLELYASVEALLKYPPKSILQYSEDLQVVRYPPKGHYGCHIDTPRPNGPVMWANRRISTFTIFLSNVTRGGELVFPGAFHRDSEDWDMDDWEEFCDKLKSTAACSKAPGLRIKPRKGDAVFWYNVRPRYLKKGRVEVDAAAYVKNHIHCGDEVIEGEKWIANLWTQGMPIKDNDDAEL